MSRNPFIYQKWPQMLILGQQYGRPWAKHPNFSSGSKRFGAHISENHLGTSFAFFGRAWHQMGQKGQYLDQNDKKCQMWLFLHALSCHLEREVDVCKGRVILARKYSLMEIFTKKYLKGSLISYN